MNDINTLLEIMSRLRDPEGGCPWDVKQDFDSIAPYTIEEAYEVADAIERKAFDELRDELGDLLFQVVFHAQMANEAGHFDFSGVLDAVCDKMVRRHPHVFGDATVEDAEAQTVAWEEQKARERGNQQDSSALAGVSTGMPEWLRSLKLQKRAAHVGFDWPGAAPVLAKIDEEALELKSAVEHGEDPDHIEEEYGDLLFVVMNLSRHLHLDPGRALRRANSKFERRFRRMEMLASARDVDLQTAGLEVLDRIWDEVKREERHHSTSSGRKE
jgi:ATP diphosphatase